MQIFKAIYGSHLFGCSVPESDEDYKCVHMETLSDLLFTDNHARQDKDESGKVKVETEDYSLRFYLKMLAGGQVIATDMFFTPRQFWTSHTSIWEDLLELKPHIISKRVGPFCGYARSQAHKYGNKGKKLLSVQLALKLLHAKVPFDTLATELCGLEGIGFKTEMTPNRPVRHITICEKSFGETTAYPLWITPLEALEARYGERARLSTSGLDLKAQYHTVRICREAIELLRDHTITFPRPEAELLLRIRTGVLSDDALRECVEAQLAELESAMGHSTLPDGPDWPVINDFIYSKQKLFYGSV